MLTDMVKRLELSEFMTCKR